MKSVYFIISFNLSLKRMLSIPTDRLHKFAAIGGIVFVLAGSASAFHQYHETALQNAEFYGLSLETYNAYNRFAALSREQIKRNEKLKAPDLNPIERDKLIAETKIFRVQIAPLDREVQDAFVKAQKQEAITEHYYLMQNIWLLLAGISIVSGTFLSWWGFKTWKSHSRQDR